MAGQVIDKCLDNRVFPLVKESGVKIFFFSPERCIYNVWWIPLAPCMWGDSLSFPLQSYGADKAPEHAPGGSSTGAGAWTQWVTGCSTPLHAREFPRLCLGATSNDSRREQRQEPALIVPAGLLTTPVRITNPIKLFIARPLGAFHGPTLNGLGQGWSGLGLSLSGCSLYSSPKGGWSQVGGGLFSRATSETTREHCLSLCQRWARSDARRNFFTKGLFNTGMDCPRRWYRHRPWPRPRTVRTWYLVLWSSFTSVKG